jgi:hypothetical protein
MCFEGGIVVFNKLIEEGAFRVHHRMAQELIDRSAFHGIARQVAVLGIAFQHALALQETSNAVSCTGALMSREAGCRERLSHSVRQVRQLSRLHPAKPRARSILAIDML